MSVNKNDIIIIHSILSHLQPKSLECVQIIKPENQFRTGCLLTDKKIQTAVVILSILICQILIIGAKEL